MFLEIKILDSFKNLQFYVMLLKRLFYQGGYRGGQNLCTPLRFQNWFLLVLTEKKPSAKQKEMSKLKKNSPATCLLVSNSGFFCSEINLAPLH